MGTPALSNQRIVYKHMSTRNTSFLNMHYYLKDIGIQNNYFFLALFDKDLAHIDPHSPDLNTYYKKKILREVMINPYYFLREVVRIPAQGGGIGGGDMYHLHRGNLALNFCFLRNINTFLELPRQNFKTMSAVAIYLWVFNYATSNSEITFGNKKHDDSKLNLARLKALREMLPSYLRMDTAYGLDGKKLKPTNRAETLEHPTNKNVIKTLPSASSKAKANSIGRGITTPLIWYDEHAFIPYIDLIYDSATPAVSQAALTAMSNNAPYGILITTTPGDLNTDEGKESFDTKEAATEFKESFYDMSDDQIKEYISRNTDSSFVYIKYEYYQLGRSEEWFAKQVIELKKRWPKIRREILLEWSDASDNSPFDKDDLYTVKGLVRRPIKSITVSGYYTLDIYKEMDLRFPPIIGVDVSGGLKRDSSAITIICSQTTDLIAELNSNNISPPELAKVIYEIVTRYLPNAVINIERNGGYGISVISKLMKTKLKRNLYYEIKDKTIEENINNGRVSRSKVRTKVYGLDSTSRVRDNLMDILRERMQHHKHRFHSKLLYNELAGLEVKRNGRIEHSSNTHDDQVISYLLALYVWYEGIDLKNRYGIDKRSIRTDDSYEEGIDSLEEHDETHEVLQEETQEELVQRQLDQLDMGTKLYNEFVKEQVEQDQQAINNLISSSPLALAAYAKKYHTDENELKRELGVDYKIPDEVFDNFYDYDENIAN